MRKYSGKKKRRQITRSTKVEQDGIKFASKLELHMYRLLKKHKIEAVYEGKTYVLIDGFEFDMPSYEKTATKKVLHDRGNKKILPIKYTPDFVDKQEPCRFIIECKGNPNEAFPIRWKLFKRFLALSDNKPALFMPRNQKDCQEVIDLLKKIL